MCQFSIAVGAIFSFCMGLIHFQEKQILQECSLLLTNVVLLQVPLSQIF